MPNTPTEPALAEALSAHLFACVSTGHFAVTIDPSGHNIPIDECLAGWRHVRSFDLGVRQVMPFEGNPEPVIRALRDSGYCILGSINPHGTSQ
jgi:hypothetical protein